MSNEMIERVSKAILETPNASDYRTLVAKNAIKAMREPTEEMIKAGNAAHEMVTPGFIHEVSNDVYIAMIDKVLE